MLVLHFLNVDNGDCIILEHEAPDTKKSFALIDSNTTKERKFAALDKLKELGAEELSFVCITHPDKDHYSGILSILDNYSGKIDQFFTYPFGRILTDKELRGRYLKQIADIARRGDDLELSLRYAELMQIFKKAYVDFLPQGNWSELTGDYDRLAVKGFGGVEFYGIMPPKKVTGSIIQSVMGSEGEKVKTLNRNEISAAIIIKYAGKTILLGGDATNENWINHRRYRSRTGLSITADIVKLPHHGSRRDNSEETLRDFFYGNPNGIAIISADGRRHPDFEIFPILDQLDCTRLCTNVCNPNERSLKRIHLNDDLTQKLNNYLNVYCEFLPDEASPCKGDISVTVSNKGDVSYSTQYDSFCGCTATELFF
jgi:beta-lactamase superfamily II metal-dependent hydrolase